MSMLCRAAAIVLLALSSSAALADGIDPGLWKIVTHVESNGMALPPHETSRCLTREQTSDLVTTFSPVSTTVNSECAPIERTFVNGKLTWRLVCKGQLDMELEAEFNFDSPHHYTGRVHSKATMAGLVASESRQTLEAQWVSECP